MDKQLFGGGILEGCMVLEQLWGVRKWIEEQAFELMRLWIMCSW